MRKLSYQDFLDILVLKERGLSNVKVAYKYNVSEFAIRSILSRKSYHDYWTEYEKSKYSIASGEKQSPIVRRKPLRGRRFVFTSAQNNTHVHDQFFETLLNYCDHNDAQLVVGTFHYNKNAFQNASDKDVWYDPVLRPYMMDNAAQIANGLVWCGELNILPTAVNPLSGLHNYTGMESGIVPHTQLQLESLPTQFDDFKFLYTTGTVTQRNYVQMKAGQKAEWHHVFGALVVEIDDDGDWFVRQISAESDTGHFYDLDKYYTEDGVKHNVQIEAINYGDLHIAKLDDPVANASWRGGRSILNVLKPKYQLLHDTYDQQARNHHNISDPHKMFELFVGDKDSVGQEIVLTANELEKMVRPWSELVVIESNHDKALERWLREADYRKDPVNALMFLNLQSAKYKAISEGNSDFSVLEYAIKETSSLLRDTIHFVKKGEHFVLCNEIYCSEHGHNGNNGARGSITSFAKQGMKMNTGHSHSAAIFQGVYTAGVSGKLNMGYNVGASSWSHSHILTYPNGKRTIVTIKNGKWRA